MEVNIEDNIEDILLEVKNLSIGFYTGNRLKQVTEDIYFSVKEGEILGIVGESGSGKSVTALSILGLLSENASIIDGSIMLEGMELTSLSDKEYRKIRGKKISMIFQEPMNSLNPVLTIGDQVMEMMLIHKLSNIKQTKNDLKQYLISVFEEVGLREPEKIYNKYPHQLSGGMRQRIMIAMAIILKPKLLIADEPTTALDVTLQLKILTLLNRINKEYNISILIISHDLSVIKLLCDRAVVMYNGKVEEQGEVKFIFNNPVKEYTRKLIDSLSVTDAKNKVNYEKARDLLLVKDLNVYYDEKKERYLSKKKKNHVVKGISFSLKQGEVLGIVGESGSGKSSVVKAVTGLINDYSGDIYITGREKVLPQMVFQDPYGSLNPSKKIGWILQEPLKLHTKIDKEERRKKVNDMLEKVGLSKEYAERYPSELSGGQKQRIAIALALMLNQKIVILDEPVSALDVTIQKQILKLLIKLKKEYELSYIFITHDMNVVKNICDRVCVMHRGEIVEINETENLFKNPVHEYTKKLLSAVI